MFVMTGHDVTKEHKFYMCYSVGVPKGTPRENYTVSKHDISTMKYSVVAFKGKYVVIAEGDEFWGGPNSKTYQSRVLTDPTWRALFGCAKAAQKKTLDVHHAFFEGAHVRTVDGKPKTMYINGEQVTVLSLSLGS